MSENKAQDQETPSRGCENKSTTSRHCYKVRHFRSKGASLVLFWNFIIWGTGTPLFISLPNLRKELTTLHGNGGIDDSYIYAVFPILAILWLVSAIVCGWLGDIRFRRHNVMYTGMVMMWVGQILLLLVHLILLYVNTEPRFTKLIIAIAVFGYILSFCSGAAFVVNTVQVGLDQLLLASTDEIISFIYWYIISANAGSLCSNLLEPITRYCSSSLADQYLGICLLKLGRVLGMSIVLCSVFFFKHWLSIQPPSPNPFTQMVKVVAYARKHNHPEQRSALTYWEDNIPTKLDLGKEKYGGPFTTEEVENVKTCLRMVLVLSSLSIFLLSFFLCRFVVGLSPYSRSYTIPICYQVVMQCLLYDKHTIVIAAVLFHEFLLYPLAAKWLPNTLKRFGIAGFLSIVLGVTLFIPDVVGHNILHDTVPCMFSNDTVSKDDVKVEFLWANALANIQIGLIIFFLTSAGFEFVMSQAPHNIRGFFIGYFWSIYATTILLADFIVVIWDRSWVADLEHTVVSCGTIYFATAAFIALIGFIVYCIVAKKYKYRQRQDEVNTHALVESVFTRYLANNSINRNNDDDNIQ